MDNIFNAPPDKYQQEFTEGAAAAVDQSISKVTELAGVVTGTIVSTTSEAVDAVKALSEAVITESGSSLSRASAVFGEALAEKGDVLVENIIGGLSITGDAVGQISSGFVETVPSKLASLVESSPDVGSNLKEYFSGYVTLAEQLSVTAPPRISAFIEGVPGYFAQQAVNIASFTTDTTNFLGTASSRIAEGANNLGSYLGGIKLNSGAADDSLTFQFGQLELDAIQGVEDWLGENPRLGLSTSQYVSEFLAEKSAKFQSIFSTIQSSPLAEGIKANIVE